MSRQGFYRLPLSTIDAVRDGGLTFTEWSMLTWLAASADYTTGIVKTSAPLLASETDTSVVTIRKTLRKLRSKDWIFYLTIKYGSYPVGIFDYAIKGGMRTPSAKEWHLHNGKNGGLISASPSQINPWINAWTGLISMNPGSQLFLREHADQSVGQSLRLPQPPDKTYKAPGVRGMPGQSIGQSLDQSLAPPENPAVLENTNVDLRSDEANTRTTLNKNSKNELAGESSSSTNNLNGRIWEIYERKYRERTPSKISPGHSRRDADETIKQIRYVLDAMRKESTTDEGYLNLVGAALDIYFRQKDHFVAAPSVKWNLKTFVARLPGILEELERRVM